MLVLLMDDYVRGEEGPDFNFASIVVIVGLPKYFQRIVQSIGFVMYFNRMDIEEKILRFLNAILAKPQSNRQVFHFFVTGIYREKLFNTCLIFNCTCIFNSFKLIFT